MKISWSKGQWYTKDRDLRYKLTKLVACSQEAKVHAEQGASHGTIL